VQGQCENSAYERLCKTGALLWGLCLRGCGYVCPHCSSLEIRVGGQKLVTIVGLVREGAVGLRSQSLVWSAR
jgi:hypothetical protein